NPPAASSRPPVQTRHVRPSAASALRQPRGGLRQRQELFFCKIDHRFPPICGSSAAFAQLTDAVLVRARKPWIGLEKRIRSVPGLSVHYLFRACIFKGRLEGGRPSDCHKQAE